MRDADELKIKILTAVAWMSGLLCLFGFFLICSIWFLVPNDPDLNQRANAISKLKPIAVVVLLIALFALISKGLFALRDRKMQLD